MFILKACIKISIVLSSWNSYIIELSPNILQDWTKSTDVWKIFKSLFILLFQFLPMSSSATWKNENNIKYTTMCNLYAQGLKSAIN